MCEKYLYGSEGGAGHDRPYPYREAPGWSVRLKTFAELTTPSAPPRWLRSFLLMAQPPLLFKEGNSRSMRINSHLSWTAATVFFLDSPSLSV